MPLSFMHIDKFWPWFPIIFAGMWVNVTFVISRLGWRPFAVRYAQPTRPPGQVYTSPATDFGNIFASYRNVVQVVFTDTGIYFYTMILFRAFHPPFFVPWVRVCRVEKRDGFFCQRYHVDIEDSAGVMHVVLPAAVETDLFKYYHPSSAEAKVLR